MSSIGEEAFCGCNAMTSLSIGKSVNNIGTWAFYKCASLESVVIPGSVKTIEEGAFWECKKLKYLTLEEGVVTIKAGAFYKCIIEKIVLPNSVVTVENEAFFQNGLDTLIIGNSVKKIDMACYQCYRLNYVENYSLIPQYVSASSFGNIGGKLHVYSGLKRTYEQSTWRTQCGFDIIDDIPLPAPTEIVVEQADLQILVGKYTDNTIVATTDNQIFNAIKGNSFSYLVEENQCLRYDMKSNQFYGVAEGDAFITVSLPDYGLTTRIKVSVLVDPAALENIYADESIHKATKRLENGKIVIEKGRHRYSLSGTEIE